MSQTVFAATTPIFSGSSVDIPDVSKSSIVKLFNNQLSIKFPAGDAIIGSNGSEASNQSVTTTVYFPTGDEGDYSNYYSIASNVFQISVSNSVYQFLYPAQLTIKYNDDITSTVADQLSIWYSDSKDFKSGEIINLGGITTPSSKTITVPIGLMVDNSLGSNNMYNGYFAIFLSQGQFDEFEDSTRSGAWSYVSVIPLWSKGIMEPLPQGSSNTEFGVQNNMNRLEFTTMLVKSLGLELPADYSEMFEDSEKFDSDADLSDDDDYSDYYQIYTDSDLYHIYTDTRPILFVEAAAKNGFVNGYNDGKFRPQKFLTREEAATILARTANLKLENDPDKIDPLLKKLFTDSDSISPWASPAVLAAAKAKLIVGVLDPSDSKGKSYQFNAKGILTRAEAATLIHRLMKKLKKL